MPPKNSIKDYVQDGYYHIYNRGVEKRIIFPTDQDYAVYLSYLKTYLLPKDVESLYKILSNFQSSRQEKDQALKMLKLNNFSDTLSLLAYCLMPNHFHLLVHQSEGVIIDSFMNSLSTRYSLYFNRKYKRVGPLFQGVYKAVRITSTEQLLYITRYIHRNPCPDSPLVAQGEALHTLEQYQYSSYEGYLGKKSQLWVKPQEVLSFFSKEKRGINSYRDFVEGVEFNEEQSWQLGKLAIQF